MQVVSLETDIEIRFYLLSPFLVGPFEREVNGQRGPARGAWSVPVASDQAGTRFGSIHDGDPTLSWGSPSGQWCIGWLELAWLQMDGWLTGGDLVVSLKGGCVIKSTQLERPNVGRPLRGMGRATNSNTLREVLSIHSSDDTGDNTTGGGGSQMTVIKRPNVDPSLTCETPTGSGVKSDRTAKGAKANKSLKIQ